MIYPYIDSFGNTCASSDWWKQNNPILIAGQIGTEISETEGVNRPVGSKMGDGVNTFSVLPYMGYLSGISDQFDTQAKAITGAQTTADGKNTIYYSPAMPSGGIYKSGDTWYDTSDGNKIYQWNGTIWVLQQFGANALSDKAVVVSKIDTVSLSAMFATIDYLKTNYVDTVDLQADYATIATLQSDYITAHDISTTYLTAENAALTYATITNLTTNYLTAQNASITYATIANLSAANGDITNLKTQFASITTAVGDSWAVDKLAAGTITAGDGVIANGAIGDAQIVDLSVAKILAGTISTTKFLLASDSGNLSISNNTLHVWDSNGKERVALGLNGSDYNLTVRAADGQTTIFGATGVTNAGITQGAVDDSKVAANANINGSKLDQESLITRINGASTLLNSSRIIYDPTGQTFDVEFQSLLNNSNTGSFSSLGTAISTMQGNFTSKIWQKDITTAVNGIQVGGTNLILETDISQFGVGNFQTNTNGVNPVVDSTKTYLNVSTIKIDGTSNIGGIQYNGYILLSRNTVYTYSMMMYSTVAFSFDLAYGMETPLHIWLNTSASAAHLETILGGTSSIPANTWTQVFVTFSTPNTQDVYYCRPFIYNYPVGAVLNVCRMKLEIGDKATDWSPAPQDVQGQISTINTTITSQQSSLTQLQSSIDACVTSSTFNTYTSNTNGSISALQSRMSSAEQKITSDAIVSTVTSSQSWSSMSGTVNTASSNASNAVNTANSASSTASTALSTASTASTTAANALSTANGIQVGGTNLVVNSNFYTGNYSNWSTWGTCSRTVITNNGVNYIHFSQNDSNFYRGLAQIIANIVAGNSYTISYTAYNASGNMTVGFHHLDTSSTIISQTWFTDSLTTVPTRFTHTFTAVAGSVSFNFMIGNSGAPFDIYIANIKLEIGNKATDWSPAPEDVQSGISAAQTTANSKSRNFTSTPTTPYYVGDTWTNPSGDILVCNTARTTGSYTASDWGYASSVTNTRIMTAEQSITPKAITTTVKQNLNGVDLASIINQTATAVTINTPNFIISAPSIDINGLVTQLNTKALKAGSLNSNGDATGMYSELASWSYYDNTMAETYNYTGLSIYDSSAAKQFQLATGNSDSDGTFSTIDYKGSLLICNSLDSSDGLSWDTFVSLDYNQFSAHSGAGSGITLTSSGLNVTFFSSSASYVTIAPNGDNVLIDNKSTDTHGSVYLGSNDGLQVTNLAHNGYKPVTASAFNTGSLAEYKQDIAPLQSARAIVESSTIYSYRLRDDVSRGIDHICYGLVIGDGYNAPDAALSVDGKAVNQYSMTSLLWRATQEISEDTKQQIASLQERIDTLNDRIAALEGKVA